MKARFGLWIAFGTSVAALLAAVAGATSSLKAIAENLKAACETAHLCVPSLDDIFVDVRLIRPNEFVPKQFSLPAIDISDYEIIAGKSGVSFDLSPRIDVIHSEITERTRSQYSHSGFYDGSDPRGEDPKADAEYAPTTPEGWAFGFPVLSVAITTNADRPIYVSEIELELDGRLNKLDSTPYTEVVSDETSYANLALFDQGWDHTKKYGQLHVEVDNSDDDNNKMNMTDKATGDVFQFEMDGSAGLDLSKFVDNILTADSKLFLRKSAYTDSAYKGSQATYCVSLEKLFSECKDNGTNNQLCSAPFRRDILDEKEFLDVYVPVRGDFKLYADEARSHLIYNSNYYAKLYVASACGFGGPGPEYSQGPKLYRAGDTYFQAPIKSTSDLYSYRFPINKKIKSSDIFSVNFILVTDKTMRLRFRYKLVGESRYLRVSDWIGAQTFVPRGRVDLISNLFR